MPKGIICHNIQRGQLTNKQPTLKTSNTCIKSFRNTSFFVNINEIVVFT